jgi:hypothetical protein
MGAYVHIVRISLNRLAPGVSYQSIGPLYGARCVDQFVRVNLLSWISELLGKRQENSRDATSIGKVRLEKKLYFDWEGEIFCLSIEKAVFV